MRELQLPVRDLHRPRGEGSQVGSVRLEAESKVGPALTLWSFSRGSCRGVLILLRNIGDLQ